MPSGTTKDRYYRDKKVLVTGGASFIGSHLVDNLVECGAQVRVADDLSSGKESNLVKHRSAIDLVIGDLRKPDFAEQSCKDIELVFHLAAAHGGRGYIESHPTECCNNMSLDHTVFAAAATNNVSRIVYASSACVYPTTLQSSTIEKLLLSESDANFDEPGASFPDGEYGWAKFMGEMQLRAFNKQYGIDGICCRIFTAYGERENESHAVIALIAKAVAKLDPYPIWGSGEQTRNFTYVGDTVAGMMKAASQLSGFRVINVGTEDHHSILDLIEIIFAHLGWRPVEIQKELDKPIGVLSRASNNDVCRRCLGWEPKWSLEEGIERTLRWYLESSGQLDLENLENLLMERNHET